MPFVLHWCTYPGLETYTSVFILFSSSAMTSRQSPTKPCQFNLPHVSQNQSPLLSSTATLYTSTLPVIAFDGLSSFYQVFFLLSNQRSIKRQRQSCCSPAENISITFHHPQDGIKLELFACVRNVFLTLITLHSQWPLCYLSLLPCHLTSSFCWNWLSMIYPLV